MEWNCICQKKYFLKKLIGTTMGYIGDYTDGIVTAY